MLVIVFFAIAYMPWGGWLRADEAPKPGEGPDAAGAMSGLAALNATWESRADVSSLNLEIPAPRGQIVDRNGLPLALNKICHYMAVQFPHGEVLTEQEVIAYASERVKLCNKTVGTTWELDEKRLLAHYKNRRTLPFVFSPPLKSHQERWLGKKVDRGLIMQPTYCRVYPQGNTAGHMIGYTGRKAKLPTGPPTSGDPLFPFSEGREGLEAFYDEQLQGTPGKIHRLYGPGGELLVEEMLARPRPGNAVVTTIDLGMQRLAERTLANYCRRGALVVLDVKTGDVLAMASRPDYDPNVFIPYIGEEQFARLRDDPSKPLFPRAYAGSYPPASTFKVSTALAALDAGVVTGESRINSPPSIKIGTRWFRNWHSKHEGKIGVERAMARSCNTWFYKVGMDTGAQNFSSMAQRLGFGERSGLPLGGETAGVLPSEAWMQEKYGHHFNYGYLANAAIGQGHVLTTPLQVAQMMAAVGNGRHLPKLRLVSQVQDLDGNVVQNFPPESKRELRIKDEHIDLVTNGLTQVVHAGFGTGKNAANGYHRVAGKTGTGQWGPPSKYQYVAWFAGFVPAHNPQYAFAALYEGRPGESLSGGKKAAPIVASYFSQVYGGSAEATNRAEIAKYTPREVLGEVEPKKKIVASSGSSSSSKKPKRTSSSSSSRKRTTVASNTRSSSPSSSSRSRTPSRSTSSRSSSSRSAPRAQAAAPARKPATAPPKRRGVLSKLFGSGSNR